MTEIKNYTIREIAPYINWIYFYHAWRVPAKSEEALRLREDAESMLAELADRADIHTIFRLCQANADGDNLLLDGVTIPLLRQQAVHAGDSPYLCLSDFVRPLSAGIPDRVGVFAATCNVDTETSYPDDPYKQLIIQALADRLAEAGTERMHEYVRQEAWGYAPDEKLTKDELLREEYQGIRPAVGYPSLPDQSVNFLLDELLDMKQIGITLTENGMMRPHASVSGLMLAHPQSHYFTLGKIGEDQFLDYARRRGLSVEEARKYLATNLSN
jgi:cobalamin-dependent methionine synthase I